MEAIRSARRQAGCSCRSTWHGRRSRCSQIRGAAHPGSPGSRSADSRASFCSLTAGHGLPQSVHPAMDHHLGLTYSSWNELLVGFVRDGRTAGQRQILNGAPDRRTEAVRGRQV